MEQGEELQQDGALCEQLRNPQTRQVGLDALYRSENQRLIEATWYKVRNLHVAEDIVAAAWEKFIASLDTTKNPNPRALLHKILKNLTIDYYRRQSSEAKKVVPLDGGKEYMASMPSVEAEAEQTATIAEIERKLNNDTQKQRARYLRLLREFMQGEEITVELVQGLFGISPKAARGTLYRFRQYLREQGHLTELKPFDIPLDSATPLSPDILLSYKDKPQNREEFFNRFFPIAKLFPTIPQNKREKLRAEKLKRTGLLVTENPFFQDGDGRYYIPRTASMILQAQRIVARNRYTTQISQLLEELQIK